MSPSRLSPAPGEFLGFDHLHFWVGNAYQAASFYAARFGLQPVAFRGLETGSRKVMTQVVQAGQVLFAFSSPLEPGNHEMGNHAMRHGDSVKDVAFRVDNCGALFEYAVRNGAIPVSAPETLRDEYGECTIATIASPYPDTWHSLVERKNYTGVFLPGYRTLSVEDPLITQAEPCLLSAMDHCVANQPDGQMEPVVDWYVRTLGFHRFWSVDDKQVHTKYSSLRSVVVADFHERVKMPVNEPAVGLRKSQIQEFVEYNAGPGIQHVALQSLDIVQSVGRLRARGVSFIKVPDSYYDDLRSRLGDMHPALQKNLIILQQSGILVDFDADGFLLQIFTRPLQDRPTFFLEIIQRNAHEGFGVGNFKSLFEAIERDQALRGNL